MSTSASPRTTATPGASAQQLPPGFDGLQYIASNPDLIDALGANALAGEQHYLAFGEEEDRETDTFDVEQYLENFPDLQEAFGDDADAATVHYIQFGFEERRGYSQPPEFDIEDKYDVEEGTTPVETLAATDPDGGEDAEVTFAITGGADADRFELTGASDDELAFADPPDFETPGSEDEDNDYEVEVTAKDADGSPATLEITVTVTDVAEPMAAGAAADDFLF
jgi:Cadherin domain